MTTCANPTCDNQVAPQPGRGRPRIYCSRRCNERAAAIKRWVKPAARLCPECGTEFEGKGHQKYCCVKHSEAAERRRRTGGQRVRRAKIASDLPARLCANPECGQPIPPTRRRNATFCSNACYRRGQSFRLYKNGWMRQHLYGITPEAYEVLLAEQDYRCAVCLVDEPAGKGGWHVDHCHDSQVVRGLLCHHCNLMLGNAKDNPETLRAAADYLERKPP